MGGVTGTKDVTFRIANSNSINTPTNQINMTGNKDFKVTIPAMAYNGKTQRAKVKVTYNGKTLVEGADKDYTVTYHDRKAVGSYMQYITGVGAYKGTIAKTLRIIPQSAKITSYKVGNKSIKLKWKKLSKSTVSFYKIYYKKTSSKKYSSVKVSYKSSSKTLKKLARGKKYNIYIKVFKNVNTSVGYNQLESSKSKTVKSKKVK
jgi:hypothetical protein